MDIGYVRVSSISQNTERQLDGMTLEKIFEDKCSGSTTERPQLKQCIDFVREGDVLHVHSIDRLARNLEDLLSLIREINQKGVVLKFQKEGMTFAPSGDNPIQKLQLQVMGAVAEFERKLILERQKEGIALAKAKGRYKGRQSIYSEEKRKSILEEAKSCGNITAIANKYHLSRPTLYRWLQEISILDKRP